jgi:hypothetical protein
MAKSNKNKKTSRGKLVKTLEVQIGGTYYSTRHSCNVTINSERGPLTWNCKYERDGEMKYGHVNQGELERKR